MAIPTKSVVRRAAGSLACGDGLPYTLAISPPGVIALFSSSRFAVPTPPKSQPARVYGTHGAGVVSPVSAIMFGFESSAPSTGAVQYLNDDVNVGVPLLR